MRQRSGLVISLGILVAFAGLLFSAGGAGLQAEEKDGKAVFEAQKCNMCHAVPAVGIESKTSSEKMKGPDLGGKIEVDFATIAAYIRKAGELDGKQHKKEFKGTDEELQAIIDWLGSLEAQE